MKICWDNLEKVKYSKRKQAFYLDKTKRLVEKDCCLSCGEPFLARIITKGDYCSPECYDKNGEKNPNYGNIYTEETKAKLRECMLKTNKIVKEKYNVDNISQLKEIKEKKGQIIINFENVRPIVEERGYELININGDNKYATLTLKCKKGHIFDMKYVYFKNGHNCVACFHDRLREQGVSNIEGYELYRKRVVQYTEINIRKNGLFKNRSKTMHVDHKYSICQGFIDNIPTYIIGAVCNLELLPASENCRKAQKCSIQKESLYNEYFKEVRPF